MKKRRTAIIAFLLCACLCIGAGYAAATDSLVVNGAANIAAATPEDFNLDVFFTDNISKSTTGTSGTEDVAALDASDTSKDTVTITVNSLKTVGEIATFNFEIENSGAETNSTVSLAVTAKSASDPTLLEILGTLGQHTLAPGQKTTLTVTVKLLRVPAETITNSAITLTVTASQVATATTGA